eukprot:3854275-Pyramimonas_sp.AAC.1
MLPRGARRGRQGWVRITPGQQVFLQNLSNGGFAQSQSPCPTATLSVSSAHSGGGYLHEHIRYMAGSPSPAARWRRHCSMVVHFGSSQASEEIDYANCKDTRHVWLRALIEGDEKQRHGTPRVSKPTDQLYQRLGFMRNGDVG